MPRISNSLLIVVVLFGSQATVRAQSAPEAGPLHVAIVADGAGNYQMASKSLRAAVAETCSPIHVETCVWSHGYKRVLPDQLDICHARYHGFLLAQHVLDYHQRYPTVKLNLVGHSAGSMVILSAAEHLPPETLERIVLLAPSVSTQYDIRPALRSVKGSVEVHYSGHDWFYLGIGMRVVGCADGQRGDASGRVGFQLRVECPQDEALLPKLVQIPWQPSYRQLGNDGGHYGPYQNEYLKAFVLPVLSR